MFKELAPLLRQRAVALTVSHLEDDQLRVTVIPQKIKDGENTALLTPVAVTGSAEQLDAELASALINFVGSHLQLKSTLERAQAEMTAAGKAAQNAARAKPKTQTNNPPERAVASPASGIAQKASEASASRPQPHPSPSLFDLPDAASTTAPSPEEQAEILSELSGERDEEQTSDPQDGHDIPTDELDA